MLRSVKPAEPSRAICVAVPESVPPDGLLPRARVMVVSGAVARLPKRSRTATLSGGAMAAPAVLLDGWATNSSAAGAAALMANGALVADSSPVAVAAKV